MQAEREIVNSALADIIKQNLPPHANEWLKERAALVWEEKNASQLNLAFAAVPRKSGRQMVKLTMEEKESLKKIHREFTIDDWTVDKVARVWLLWQVDSSDKENYFSKLENLFRSAEMNELAALYAALPGFDYPEEWQKRCAEGIRSNIGIVLEAIMYNNPYPGQYLNEQAWNQLVLKAFFTDKNVNRIIGLDERSNKELAAILIDYAHERWAAHRAVNPQLWRLVSKCIDSDNFDSIVKAFGSNDLAERKGAALACFYSNYQPARQLVEKDQELLLLIEQGKLDWNNL